MADDIDTEIQEIEAGMSEDNAAYWKDTAKQERYGQLLAAKESGSPAPAGPDAATARRAEIETLMADPRSKYWRGSRSEAIQAEYRDLIAVDGEPGRREAQAGRIDAISKIFVKKNNWHFGRYRLTCSRNVWVT